MDKRLRQVHMDDRSVERYSTALPVSDMQIKTTARHHYTPTRAVKNRKTDNIKIQGNWSSIHSWLGGDGVNWFNRSGKLMISTQGKHMALRASSPLPPREMGAHARPHACSRMCASAFFTGAQSWKLPKCPLAIGWADVTH